MLIALFTILFLSGGAGTTALLDYIGDVQDSVKTVMPEGEQRTAALSTVKTIKERTKARNKSVGKLEKQMNKALNDHGIADADLDAIWAEYFRTVREFNREVVDLRFELKEYVSREEWQAIFADGT